jgi:hypothetical protein
MSSRIALSFVDKERKQRTVVLVAATKLLYIYNKTKQGCGSR